MGSPKWFKFIKNMNVCAKCEVLMSFDNPPDRHQKCDPHGGAAGEVRGAPKSAGFILWGP